MPPKAQPMCCLLARGENMQHTSRRSYYESQSIKFTIIHRRLIILPGGMSNKIKRELAGVQCQTSIDKEWLQYACSLCFHPQKSTPRFSSGKTYRGAPGFVYYTRQIELHRAKLTHQSRNVIDVWPSESRLLSSKTSTWRALIALNLSEVVLYRNPLLLALYVIRLEED